MFTNARDGPQGLMCASKHSTNRAVSPDLIKITSALLEAQTKTKLLYCCICEGWGQWSPYLWLPILWFQLLMANESEHGRIYMYTVCYLEKEQDPTSTTLQFVPVWFFAVLERVPRALCMGSKNLPLSHPLPAHSFYYTILLQY